MNEVTDDLRSKAILSILDLIGEGEIGGLVDGLKSVYLNDTPIQNADGTLNFQGVTANWVNGTNTQEPLQNFGNYIETPYNANVQIKAATPYTFTVANSSANSVRIIMTLPSLFTQSADTGDISGSTVQYKFSISVNNGAFTDLNMTGYYESGGSWSLVSGYNQANTSGYAGTRATIKGTCNVTGSGWVTVQAQEYNGSAWVNLGDQKTLSVFGAMNASSILVATGDSYTVQSNYSLVRFVTVAQSSSAFFIATQSLEGLLKTGTVTISGKSKSRYQRAHIIPITPGTNTRIRITRLTADSATSLVQNETYIESYTEIVSLNMRYPNSALFGLSIDSQQFNQVPSRAYLVDGLYINVPTNYDPVARTYSGVWNGTFKRALSNNPAWIMYDILTNSRYGLGQFISSSQVDKSALYAIGKYCDVYVPDGYGGVEPRFVCNTVIGSQVDAYRVISDLASVFRGMGFWDGGTVSFMQDSPADPVMLYSPANVIDGIFTYTGSARKDRHSVVHVTWNDPAQNYKKAVEYVEDSTLVAQYGIRKLDTIAFGCTSRGQAARVGRWILYTERNESDFVSFKVGLDSAFVSPGDIVKIHDTSRAGKRMAGRLTAYTATSATLDSAVTLGSGPNTISIMLPDGTFVDRAVNEFNGTFTKLNWGTALTTLPQDNALWMTSEPTLVPMLARVISISQGDKAGEFEITAAEHNPSKFGAIESGLALEKRATSIIDPSFVQTPTQLVASESRYLAAQGVVANKINLSWYSNSTLYEIAWRGKSATNQSNWTRVQVSGALSYEIMNAALGAYDITVTGINPLGQRSATVSTTYTVVGKLTPPSNVTGLTASAQPTGVELYWTNISDIDVASYEVRACSSIGQVWESGTPVATVTAPRISATLPLPAPGTYEWLVKAIDLSGNYSTTATRVQLTIAVPSAPVVSYELANDQIKINWTVPGSTLGIESYEVRYGSTWQTAASLGTVKGTTLSTPAKWLGDRIFWVAGIDPAGNYGTPGQRTITITAPQAPSMSQQVVDNNVLLFWTTPASMLPIDTYELRRGSTWATATVIGTKTGNFTTVFEMSAGNYTYLIAARDVAGNLGTVASITTTVSQPPDYVLRVNSDVVSTTNTPAGTFVNAARDTDGSYVLPVNSTETFAQHFTSRSWTSPDNQIAAGYPIFIEPALSPGYYEETIDYGMLIASTKVNVTASGIVLSGSPTTVIDISVKANLADPWTVFPNTTNVLVSSFRYVKVRFTVSGNDTSLYRLSNLNVRLDAKLKNDAGSGTAGASDSVTGTSAVINGVTYATANPTNAAGLKVPDGQGTLVVFGTTFVDVASIDLSIAAGSTARYGVYDFVDVPNASGFKVLLYDASGNRVGGSFSWSAKGY